MTVLDVEVDVDAALAGEVPCEDYDDAVVRRWLVLRRAVQVPCEAPAVVMVRLICRCGDCCPEHNSPNEMALCEKHLEWLQDDAADGWVDILAVVPIGAGS